MLVFDIILGVLLVYALYKGIRNGLFVELASFISLVVGIYFAIKFSYFLKGLIASRFSWNPNTIQVVAFVLTFILVVIGITLLAKILTKMADFAYLGWMNALGGGCFRLLKTILILSVLFAVFEKINFDNTFAKESTLDNSIFYRPIQKVARFVYPSIEEFYEQLRKEKKQEEPIS
ncbi:CvpA family protein [Flavobacterium sp. SE-1-e]|uniref:CvpA family protein n=1 Tax=Flavobacterium agrisoli TaxID=2793066 RepID=A0A934PMU7_9FLAO|nr:CvpA family protein [Flavobacterium agrisoli]